MRNKLFLTFTLIVISINVVTTTCVINNVTMKIESFENYPIGIYPEIGVQYEFRYWFPENTTNPSAEIVNDRSYQGEKSVKVYMDGRKDDGSIWFLTELLVSNPISFIELSGLVWSSQQSDFNTWPIIAYIGVTEPISNETKQEEDFTIIGETEMNIGWTNYSYSRNMTSIIQEETKVYIAFGISVTWETERFYWIDELKIKIFTDKTPMKIIKAFDPLLILLGTFLIAYIKKKKNSNNFRK